jgi:uncharacterized protein (TIGR02145 family)
MKKLTILMAICVIAYQCKKVDSNTLNNLGTTLTASQCDSLYWNQTITYGTVKDIDGNEYKTVKIGPFEWMAENLKVTHFNNGDPIPSVKSNSDWSKLNTPAYSFYTEYLDKDKNGIIDDSVSYQECFGNLYNMYVVKDNRNVCPTGWHIISSEGKYLRDSLVTYPNLNAAKKIKSLYGWGDDILTPKGNGDDIFGFRALPGGLRYGNGEYDSLGLAGHWWLKEYRNQDSIYLNSFSMYYDNDYFYLGNGGNDTGDFLRDGYSIRCIKD